MQLCIVDGLIDKVNILHEFITSNHKPVFVTFKGMKDSLQAPTTPQQDSIPIMYWYKADALCINSYQTVLDEAHSYVDIPVNLLHENDIKSILQVNKYYGEIVTCIFVR